MAKKTIWSALLGISVMASFSASGEETIDVEGNSVTCENSCVVTEMPDGTFDVQDSDGGWLRWNINGPLQPGEDPIDD